MSLADRRGGWRACGALAALALALALALILPGAAHAADSRLALVIGNAAYRGQPLDNPVNDARLIAATLRRAGFEVDLRENLGRTDLLGALRDFGNRLGDNSVAVLYYAGHGLQLRDRNYLIPVDADIRSEDEIPVQGLDLGFILGRMSHARSRVNIVILDACRNNPYAGKTVSAPTGLAQMDAPVGTLLAFATAPGKIATDGAGGNSLYATYVARHLLTPGLPVELMFKRVREEVVRDSGRQQVPWESSSLQGEFAFVAAPPPVPPPPVAAAPPAPAPSAVTIAAAPLTAASPAPSPAARTLAARLLAAGGRPELLPQAGDTWRYRVHDQFRLGDLMLTLKVEEITADGVVESWTTPSDTQPRTATAAVRPGFNTLPGWTLTPAEFSPYLLASGLLRPGQALAGTERVVEQLSLPLQAKVEGEEEVQVAAGRFRAVKLVLRGQATPRGAGAAGQVSAEHIVWYVPEVKRPVKYTVQTRVGNTLRESASFELTEFQLH